MSQLLILFHCASNAGYAMDTLERVFYAMGIMLMGDSQRLHFAFTSLQGGRPLFLPPDFENIICWNSASESQAEAENISTYIKEHQITMAFGFDQPLSRPGYPIMRAAGVRRMISYYGAPMSSINTGVKALLKRMEARVRTQGPDHFIFESKAMARTATHGRGIPIERTSVVYIGVDTAKFTPYQHKAIPLWEEMGIPRDRKVIVYAGHMESRKGVHVLVGAARELVVKRGRRDVHFLIMGNRPGEEKPFLDSCEGSLVLNYMTFGGYKKDIERLFVSCDLGVIASTGWDSFTVSAVEMAASGLPLVVSDLGGLVEAIECGYTGLTVPPGDVGALADALEKMLDDDAGRTLMGQNARRRAVEEFSQSRQIQELVAVCRSVYGGLLPLDAEEV